MTKVEENLEPAVDRRSEKRVTYTAILGFRELKGKKIPPIPSKPNAIGANLSLGGICFQSQKRPKSEFLVLYLPDGARAAVRVASVTEDVDPLKSSIHCEVLRWLPDGAKTMQPTEPDPVDWTQDEE